MTDEEGLADKSWLSRHLLFDGCVEHRRKPRKG